MSHIQKYHLWPDALKILTTKEKYNITNKHIAQYKKLLTNELIPLSNRNVKLLSEFYIPLATWIMQQATSPFVLGINGAQGSGKSTFAKILKQILMSEFKLSVVILSIDDLYLSKNDRLKLSKSTHPLLATRGVPGTHDITLGINLLEQLKAGDQFPIHIPVFDKSNDDRADQIYWQTINHQPDIILFEGWCVGAIAENEDSLNAPINDLEENQDSDCKWRKYVNNHLNTDYQLLFSKIDSLIMLKAPDFNKIIEWRTLQENKLKQQIGNQHSNASMSEEEIKHFIMHYERITRNTLNEMPDRATLVFEVDKNHCISNTVYNK